MRPKIWIAVVLLAALGASAWPRRAPRIDLLAPETLATLLESPLHRGTEPDESGPPPSFWRALLAHPSTAREGETYTLRLGRVLTEPSAAHLAAERAGELLAPRPDGPSGTLEVPLARAVLEGPATHFTDTGREVWLYGCRHSADPDAGPMPEASYVARCSLVAALEAAARESGKVYAFRGADAPVKGGVNFDVRLIGEERSIEVTFDGTDRPPLRARLAGRPDAPNDARARENLVRTLEALAHQSDLTLVLEGRDAPAPGGIDVLIECYGERLAISASGGGKRFGAHHDPPAR